jgi:flagellar biosynthesis GTPase FlhF
MTEEEGRRHLEGVALGLQNHKWRSQAAAAAAESSDRTQQAVATAVKQTEQAAELERQRQEAQAREQARRRREQAEARRKTEEEERDHRTDTPQQVLHKIYSPLFQMVWNLEFANLGNINPFRMIIDRDNCAAVGAPDYFDIIDKPMNLTWIQQKVERKEYRSLQTFFGDMDLMIDNALKYNSDASNPYRVAALELRQKYKAAAKKLVAALKQHSRG